MSSRSASGPCKRRSLCIACLVALDFERTRILDWIAYHEMSGVDCFILVLDDKRMSEAASRRVLEQLRSVPDLVAIFGPADTDSIISETLNMQYHVNAEFFMYIDVDEWLAIDETTVQPSLVPWARRTLDRHAADAIRLLRWRYLTNGYERLTGAQLASEPEVAYLTRREIPLPPFDGANPSRRCVLKEGAKGGKVLFRVDPARRGLVHMHRFEGRSVLSDGTP